MNRQGFLKLRNGLVEHVNGHQFTVSDLGVYTFLHLNKNWRTGICWTNAKGVATTLDDSPHSSIKDSFRRLREKKYIQYRQGDGSRSNYAVLLIEDEPTDGILKGCRLKGFADNNFDKVVYDVFTADRPDAVLRASARRLEVGWSSSGDRLVTVPLQDLQDYKTYKTLSDEEELQHRQAAVAAAPARFSAPEVQAQKPRQPEVCDSCHEPETSCKSLAACTWTNPEVLFETPTSVPDSEPNVAGYKMSTIREHVRSLIASGDKWVEREATEDALRRPGFVDHVMALEPKKKIKRAVPGRQEPQPGSYKIKASGDIS